MNRVAFPELISGDRVIVTGASGWMGREVVGRLLTTRPDVDVLPLGSHERIIETRGGTARVQAWVPEAARAWGATVVLHLAFLTREHLRRIPEADYRTLNGALTTLASELLAGPKLRAFVYASSGAAADPTTDAYASLKASDEQHFQSLASEREIACVVARIWSVTGMECTKPETFAFFDILRQAVHEPTIRLNAQRAVWRSYADAGEFLEACTSLACTGRSDTLNSWGSPVELGALAEMACEVLGTPKTLERGPWIDTPDVYCSPSDEAAVLAEHLGIPVADLERQIRRCLGLFAPLT